MMKTSAGWLAPSRPTEAVIGGATRPIGSVLRMVVEGTSAKLASVSPWMGAKRAPIISP